MNICTKFNSIYSDSQHLIQRHIFKLHDGFLGITESCRVYPLWIMNHEDIGL